MEGCYGRLVCAARYRLRYVWYWHSVSATRSLVRMWPMSYAQSGTERGYAVQARLKRRCDCWRRMLAGPTVLPHLSTAHGVAITVSCYASSVPDIASRVPCRTTG
eukprot:1047490-Rhodomonas_salina.1